MQMEVEKRHFNNRLIHTVDKFNSKGQFLLVKQTS